MKCSRSLLKGFMGSVAGVLFATSVLLMADTDIVLAADNCTKGQCVVLNDFVGPGLGGNFCYRFEVKSCSWCWNGRCSTRPANTDKCDEVTPQIWLYAYPLSSCSPLCDLTSTFSEATPISGIWTERGLVNRGECKARTE